MAIKVPLTLLVQPLLLRLLQQPRSWSPHLPVFPAWVCPTRQHGDASQQGSTHPSPAQLPPSSEHKPQSSRCQDLVPQPTLTLLTTSAAPATLVSARVPPTAGSLCLRPWHLLSHLPVASSPSIPELILSLPLGFCPDVPGSWGSQIRPLPRFSLTQPWH